MPQFDAGENVPAFPGAEGFGTRTVHARGKAVIHVTRLDDEDKGQDEKHLKPGQFRWALAVARKLAGAYIVFDVSGMIRLKRKAEVPPNTYIAGQTVPGNGTAFSGASIVIGDSDSPTHDVLIRHVRHRGGLRPETDAFLVRGKQTRNIILDHVSVSFFRDGAAEVVDAACDVTMQ